MRAKTSLVDRQPGRAVGPRGALFPLGNSATLVEEKCGTLTRYPVTQDEEL